MPEYRVDDLARAANVTTRNIRAYRERGLLPEPHRRGRTNFYDETHLERLKLIDTLLQRGFTINHIADFIEGWEKGKSLTEILGLPRPASRAWERDHTFELPLEVVEEFLTGDAETLNQLVRMDMARIEEGTVVFTEPQLVRVFIKLQQYGFQLRPVVGVMAEIAEKTNDIARIMIRAAVDVIASGATDDVKRPRDVARAIDQLTELTDIAMKSVNVLLARAVDENLKRGMDAFIKH